MQCTFYWTAYLRIPQAAASGAVLRHGLRAAEAAAGHPAAEQALPPELHLLPHNAGAALPGSLHVRWPERGGNVQGESEAFLIHSTPYYIAKTLHSKIQYYSTHY